jgi:hypothetical protein
LSFGIASDREQISAGITPNPTNIGIVRTWKLDSARSHVEEKVNMPKAALGSAHASGVDLGGCSHETMNSTRGVTVPPSFWLVALCMTWVLVGLVGHDPWKPDEAYTFGLVLDFLEHGDWVVPRLAGEAFLEKPPLFFITAAAFASAFRHVLPVHDAARLATGF